MEQALEKIPTWNPPPIVTKQGPVHSVQVRDGWYRVRGGDSLATIAKRFRLSVHDLKARNHLPSHRIKPGDLLAVAPHAR